MLGAKLIAYTNLGLLYGLVNVLSASLGALAGGGVDGFGEGPDWLIVSAAGLLAMVLWTLLGVGFGALVANPVIVIIVLLVYKFVFEFIVDLFLVGSDASGVVSYLPGAAGSGICLLYTSPSPRD